MKKLFCALIALALLSCTALAEGGIIENPQIIVEMIAPSPSPEPVGETFSSEDLIVTLPAGMVILDSQARAGYDAAVDFDFPAAGNAILLAVREDGGAALSFSILENEQDAAAAAREAAAAIFGSDDAVKEITLGENSYSTIRCAVGEDSFRIFFLSDGKRLLCVGASGLRDEEIHTMLTGLDF